MSELLLEYTELSAEAFESDVAMPIASYGEIAMSQEVRFGRDGDEDEDDDDANPAPDDPVLIPPGDPNEPRD